MESLARSPIYAQFSESLAGCTVIRAFGLEKAFLNTCNNKVDDNHRIYFHMWVISRWFSLYSGFISSTFVLIASCAILFMNVDAGWAGIVLSYSFEFTVNLRRIVTSHANLEMEMNGVERVLEYTSIDQEDASIIESNRTPENVFNINIVAF